MSEKIINVKYELIDKLIGVKIDRKIINNILTNLGFGLSDAPKQGLTSGGQTLHPVPSFRANDINIPEDIIEEVARVYGYQIFPRFYSQLFTLINRKNGRYIYFPKSH